MLNVEIRGEKNQKRQLTEHTSPEQKVKVVSKYQHEIQE